MERTYRNCQKVNNTSWISSSFDSDEKNPDSTASQRKRKKIENNVIKKTRSGTAKSGKSVLKQDHVTWVEKHSPKTKDHLAVNRKKILQVEEWIKWALSACVAEMRAPVLLLTGPSGCGKTATVKVLASELKLELKEWSNVAQLLSQDPWTCGLYGDFTISSQAALFSRFLLQENKYFSVFTKYKCQKLILIEEYPNSYLKDVSLFHSVLQKYQKMGKCPLIFILSDHSKGQTFEQLLFPKHIMEELSLSVISFNSASLTMIVKALQQIVQDCNLLSKTRRSVLENIAAVSSGDIRNAINCLQFMYNPIAGGFSTRDKSKKSTVAEEREGFPAVGRDTSLFLFHSLGKILYNKRETDSCENVFPQDKAYLNRPQLKENPEEVFRRTSTSSTAFSLFLHQNYLDFVDNVEIVSDCCTYFGDSDIICSEWTEQNILQDYSASIVSRSLMFYLYSKNSNNRWRPLHKPQWYDKQKLYNANFTALRAISQRWKLAAGELSTQLLPYLIKISPLRLTTDEKKVIATYGAITCKHRADTKAYILGEKEVYEDYPMEDSTLIGSALCEITADNIENEEYLIEEYEDK